jgi:hypothetical protein
MSAPITYAGRTWPSARDWCLSIMQHNAAPGPAQDGQCAALDAYRAEVLRQGAAAQLAFARERWLPAAGDSISAAGKKDRKYGVAETLAHLIDPTTPLRPRFIRVLPHEGGFLVRWQIGEESRAKFWTSRAAADAAVAELRGLAAGLAVKDAAAVAAAGESTRPEPVVPRTERSYWVAIADALNAAASAGMAVGIEVDGTLTDYRAWSVVWNREVQRWEVGGYDDDGLPDTRSPGRVPAAPDFFQPGHTYQRRRWLFQCLAVAPTPFNGETRAIGFLYRPGDPATVTGLDPDDWEQGGWTEKPEDGGR